MGNRNAYILVSSCWLYCFGHLALFLYLHMFRGAGHGAYRL